MENFDTINTKGILKEQALSTALRAEQEREFSSQIQNITIGLSTGTSGKRGIFMVAETERAQWAAMVMHRVVKPVLFKKQKVAFFLRANSNLYTSVQSLFFEFRYFDIFQPIETLARELEVFQPHVLAAQPSVLVHLAEFKKEGTLSIQPEKIISFAEVLYPEDKKFILSVFHSKFSEVYQCTEGFLGVTCAHGTMHLNEDIVMIEKQYLDERRFHPVITDFTRSTQPVVRYVLNDVLAESAVACPCGSCFTSLERIEGRENDCLLFLDTQGKQILVYPDLIARLIARATDEFRNYKIRQVSLMDIEVELEIEAAKFDSVSYTISNALQQFLEERFIDGVKFSYKAGVTVLPGAKVRKIERTF